MRHLHRVMQIMRIFYSYFKVKIMFEIRSNLVSKIGLQISSSIENAYIKTGGIFVEYQENHMV